MLHACRKGCNSRAGHAVLKNSALPIQLPIQLSIQLRKQTTTASPQPYKKRESSPPKAKPSPEKTAASRILETSRPVQNPPKPNEPPPSPPSLPPINPPSSTRPPPLDLPIRSPSTSKPKHLFALGKAYLTFYKTGLKALYHNIKLIRASTNPHCSLFASSSSLRDALATEKITRAQYHLIARTKTDVSRIPLFMVVFACCGEFTPLLVPFISPVIPKCVWLPVQWEKMRRKREARRGRWWRSGDDVEGGRRAGVEALPETAGGEGGGGGAEEGGGKQDRSGTTTATAAPNEILRIEAIGKDVQISGDLGSIGARINAWPRLLDRVYGWVPSSVLLGQLSGTAQALVVDDLAIKREGLVIALVDEEVKMAMDARGQDILGKEVQELREQLEECVRTHGYLLKENRV